MEAWQRRYTDKKQLVYKKIKDKLMKTKQPDYINATTFQQVIDQTAMRLAEKYMTSLRTGERNV